MIWRHDEPSTKRCRKWEPAPFSTDRLATNTTRTFMVLKESNYCTIMSREAGIQMKLRQHELLFHCINRELFYSVTWTILLCKICPPPQNSSNLSLNRHATDHLTFSTSVYPGESPHIEMEICITLLVNKLAAKLVSTYGTHCKRLSLLFYYVKRCLVPKWCCQIGCIFCGSISFPLWRISWQSNTKPTLQRTTPLGSDI